MDDFIAELKKISPVTRFLCASSLAVSVPSMLSLVSPYKLIFIKQLVTKNLEIWRVYTSFFLGGSGMAYLFNFIMLYRTSESLESGHYPHRSPDFAWQLLLVAGGIMALSVPLGSYIHERQLQLALIYLLSALSPPGTTQSLFGLISIPMRFFPFALIAMDFVMGGPRAAAAAVVGCVVGHAWWWAVFDNPGTGTPSWAKAPSWVKAFVASGPAGSEPPPPPTRPGRGGEDIGGGISVVQPRSTIPVPRSGPARTTPSSQASSSSGYSWGTGQRLGSD